MNVSRVNLLTFSGRIKNGQIGDKTKEEVKKQEQNDDINIPQIKIYKNCLSTGAGTTGVAVPTVFILMPLSDKSV